MPVVKLQTIKIPGVAWFAIIAIIMYLAPYIARMINPETPDGLAELIVLIGGTILRTIDISVRTSDREQLIELIRKQQEELARHSPTAPTPAAPSSTPPSPAAGPVLRGAKPKASEQPVVATVATPTGSSTVAVPPAPGKLSRWFWG